jgi:hypothetical protein
LSNLIYFDYDDVVDNDKKSIVKDINFSLKSYLKNTFNYDIEDPSQNIFTDLAIKFSLNDPMKFGENHPMEHYIKNSSIIHRTHKEYVAEFFHPQDFIIINHDHSVNQIQLEEVFEKQNLADKLDQQFADERNNQNTKDWVGGGVHEQTPVNGAKKIYINQPQKNNVGILETTWVVGHVHTLYQFFASNVLEQAMANLHPFKSSLMIEPKNAWELVSFHTGIHLEAIKID